MTSPQFATLALLLLALTGSGLGVAGAVLAKIAPVLLLAPLAGSLVDPAASGPGDGRRRPRAGPWLPCWPAGTTTSRWPTRSRSGCRRDGSSSARPRSPCCRPVVEDEDLVAANSGIWTAAVTAQILVAPVAALITVEVGFGVAFAVNCASFALSALVPRGLAETARPMTVSVRSPLAHAHEALYALAADPLLMALAAGQFLAIGLGAATGPLLLVGRIEDPRRPLFVLGPYAVCGLVDLVLAAVTALPLAGAALVAYGLSTSIGNVTFSSLVQSRVPDELRGRVFAEFDVLWQTGRMLSWLGGGLLADGVGIRAVYLLGGLLLGAAGVGAAEARAADSTS